MKIRLHILGARGSVPVHGEDTSHFGGATSAYLLETPDEAVFLDAGTGLLHAPDVGKKRISLLLSHPHADHLLGLSFFPYLTEKDREITIYARERNGQGVREQLSRLYSPPLWPCGLTDYPACVRFRELPAGESGEADGKTGCRMRLGEVIVDMLEAVHPGGSTIYRLTCGDKSVVYATDVEYTREREKELIDFFQGAELLLMDGQYTPEEYEKRRGYGHSTAQTALWLAEKARVRRLLIVHHDPRHTDEALRAAEAALQAGAKDALIAAYARAGEVWEL